MSSPPRTPADRRDRRGHRAPGRPGDRGPQERALRRRACRATAARRSSSMPPSDEGTRAAAFASMDGLLISGGADLASGALRPAEPRLDHDGAGPRRARGTRPGSPRRRGALPVLGLCRGFQAINAFSGGTLLQHVDGHQGPRWGSGPAKTHPLRVAPGTRLARHPLPDQRRRWRAARQLVSPPGRPAVGPRAGTRRECLGQQPGRRPDRGPGGGRRALRLRCPVPSRADRIRRRRPSSGCSASSSTPREGRPTAADPPSVARAEPTAGRPR